MISVSSGFPQHPLYAEFFKTYFNHKTANQLNIKVVTPLVESSVKGRNFQPTGVQPCVEEPEETEMASALHSVASNTLLFPKPNDPPIVSPRAKLK